MSKRKHRLSHRDRADAEREVREFRSSMPREPLRSTGEWSDERARHLGQFRHEVRNVYQRYLAEYDCGWVELIGVLDMVRHEIIKSALRDGQVEG